MKGWEGGKEGKVEENATEIRKEREGRKKRWKIKNEEWEKRDIMGRSYLCLYHPTTKDYERSHEAKLTNEGYSSTYPPAVQDRIGALSGPLRKTRELEKSKDEKKWKPAMKKSRNNCKNCENGWNGVETLVITHCGGYEDPTNSDIQLSTRRTLNIRDN